MQRAPEAEVIAEMEDARRFFLHCVGNSGHLEPIALSRVANRRGFHGYCSGEVGVNSLRLVKGGKRAYVG